MTTSPCLPHPPLHTHTPSVSPYRIYFRPCPHTSLAPFAPTISSDRAVPVMACAPSPHLPCQLAHARPGHAPPVEELATAIDAADHALAAARGQQVAALEQLYQQEVQLEVDIEAIGSRLDEEMVADAERAAPAFAAATAGADRAPARPVSGGPRWGPWLMGRRGFKSGLRGVCPNTLGLGRCP
jgi:hypothetical protein